MNDMYTSKKTFRKLIKACHEHDAYSVPMMCAKANISYAQIQAWAQEDKMWENVLDMCKTMCKGNAESAALMGRMPLKEMIPFMNNDE